MRAPAGVTAGPRQQPTPVPSGAPSTPAPPRTSSCRSGASRRPAPGASGPRCSPRPAPPSALPGPARCGEGQAGRAGGAGGRGGTCKGKSAGRPPGAHTERSGASARARRQRAGLRGCGAAGAAGAGRGGAHGGGGRRAPGGRAGEAQRRAAAPVEAEALRAHRARPAALRGQGRRRPAQGAQLRVHQGRGVRGEHRAPHLLHAGDRGRRRDRLPLPAGGPGLERPDHPGAGQVQEPAGHPDGAGPAEPGDRGSGDWDPRVLNLPAPHRLGARGQVSFPAPCGLHLARQSCGHVQEASAQKGRPGREGAQRAARG